MRGELHESYRDNGEVPYLQCGSFRRSLTLEELQCLQAMVQTALRRLDELRNSRRSPTLTGSVAEKTDAPVQ